MQKYSKYTFLLVDMLVSEDSWLSELYLLSTYLTSFNFDFSWYFGAMTRAEATDILMSEKEGGVFLVRDSATIQGDYVLCVR